LLRKVNNLNLAHPHFLNSNSDDDPTSDACDFSSSDFLPLYGLFIYLPAHMKQDSSTWKQTNCVHAQVEAHGKKQTASFLNTQIPHGFQHSELPNAPHMISMYSVTVLEEILTALFNIVYVNSMYVTE